MRVKPLVSRHYRQLVDDAAKDTQALAVPPEGWIRTVRKALNMSGAQLAARIGSTRGLVSQTEKNETFGKASVKSLQQMADAMGCRLVYAIIPKSSTIESLIADQARKKARTVVQYAGQQMALEDQALNPKQMEREIERLQNRFISEMPSDLWNDK